MNIYVANPQIVFKVITTEPEIIDIFTDCCVKKPDIGILSPQFLAEVREWVQSSPIGLPEAVIISRSLARVMPRRRCAMPGRLCRGVSCSARPRVPRFRFGRGR